MTETATSIKALLQPYADSDDPRFAALRGKEHEWGERSTEAHVRCKICHFDLEPFKHNAPPYCLRTDLDALVDVAAACGWTVSFKRSGSTWWSWLAITDGDKVKEASLRGGDTKQDALAQAFVAAVPLTPTA